jgi:hypothetical protein
MTPNKTFTTAWPDWLAPELHSHFVRGLSDGDGSIWNTPAYKGRPAWSWSLCGTETLCAGVQQVLIHELDIAGSMGKHPSDGIAQYSVGGHRQLERLLRWLYADSPIHLARKHRLADQFLTARRSL